VIDRCVAVMTALALTASAATFAASSGGTRAHSADVRQMHAAYAALPLLFERSRERNASGRFVARGADYAVAISNQGAQLAFASASPEDPPVGIRFLDGNPDAIVAGLDARATRIHHIRHGDARDEVDVPAYTRIAISNLHPGIDVVFHGRGRELEYDAIVAAGADPARFAFRVEGSEGIAVDAAGDLVLATSTGRLTLKRPVAYQDIDGARHFIPSEFAVDEKHVVRIRVGDYDPARALVIDPVVSYATYLGGSGTEQGTAIAVDAAGNAYVTGYTTSTDFPLVNALDRSMGKRGDVEVFVSKLNPAGTALVWSTYIGGSAGTDRAIGIAVDATGSVYVTGQTSGVDFPTSANAWQKAITGGGAFVTKLAPAGNALVYSTYLAGATPSGIAVDASGNAYVSGSAASSFVTTPGALQPMTGIPAGITGFALKLNATGSAPLFATFLGGTGGEDVTSIALDGRGGVYAGGWTTSVDFPVLNAFQSARSAGKDGFIAKLANDGSALIYSTLLGGSLDDAVNAIAVDGTGNVYVAGETYSSDFPVRNGFQMHKAGFRLINSSVGNAFVAKLSATGRSLVYSSFIGGEVCETLCQLAFGPQPQFRADAAYGIAVDNSGHAYVTGIARSYTFPLVDSTSPRKQQDNEDSAFVVKVATAGSALLWSTFLRTGFGESDNKWTRLPPGAATGVSVDAAGAAYVTGDADSQSHFQPSANAFQTVSTFGPAALIVKFPPAPAMTLTTSNPAADTQTPVTLTAALSGPITEGTVLFMDGTSWIGSGVLLGNKASTTLLLPAGIHVLSATVRLSDATADTSVVSQVVDVPLVCN
jgi:hypothetical protein